jgi:hypothetical protein
MADNYYFAVPGTNARGVSYSDGYLVTNGESYAAGSGGYGNGMVPFGQYQMHAPESLNANNPESMVPGGWRRSQARKVRISGVGDRDAGWDPQRGYLVDDPAHPGQPRFGELLHYNANRRTEGCIGYDDPAAQGALATSISQGKTSLEVFQVPNLRVAQQLGDIYAHPEKYQDFHDRHPDWGRSAPTKTEEGDQVKEGQNGVVLSPEQLRAAHQETPLVSGDQIREGANGVRVGPQQRPFARQGDATRRGQRLRTGVPSVTLGD